MQATIKRFSLHHNMKWFYTYRWWLIGLLCIQACASNVTITLSKEGKAQVSTNFDQTFYKKDFYKKPLISDFSYSPDSQVNYRVAPIDSLGNYVFYRLNSGFMQFRLRGDTLFYSEQGRGFRYGQVHACWTSYLEINSERKIKSLQYDKGHVRQRENSVYIQKNWRKFKRPSKNTSMVIVFEPMQN